MEGFGSHFVFVARREQIVAQFRGSNLIEYRVQAPNRGTIQTSCGAILTGFEHYIRLFFHFFEWLEEIESYKTKGGNFRF